MKDIINNNIINILNRHTEKYGYSYSQFNKLNSSNVEINSINVSYLIQQSNNFNLNDYSSCLNKVFTIYNGVINDDNSSAELVYKRVSNYKEMDDIETLITVFYKNNYSIPEIISKLKEGFEMSLEKAKSVFLMVLK